MVKRIPEAHFSESRNPKRIMSDKSPSSSSLKGGNKGCLILSSEQPLTSQNNSNKVTNCDETNVQKSIDNKYREKIIQKIFKALQTAVEGNSDFSNKDDNKNYPDYYAKAIEKKMYDLANCQSQYCHLIYEKLERIKNGSAQNVIKEASVYILTQNNPQFHTSIFSKEVTNQNYLFEKENLLNVWPKAYLLQWELISKPFMENLFHSEKCNQGNDTTNEPNMGCHGLPCRFMNKFLNHFETCSNGLDCNVYFLCSVSQKACLAHWLECKSSDCQNCRKIISISQKIFKNFADFYMGNSSNKSSLSTFADHIGTAEGTIRPVYGIRTTKSGQKLVVISESPQTAGILNHQIINREPSGNKLATKATSASTSTVPQITVPVFAKSVSGTVATNLTTATEASASTLSSRFINQRGILSQPTFQPKN